VQFVLYNKATTRPAAAAAISRPETRRPAAAVTCRVPEVVLEAVAPTVPIGVLILVVRLTDRVGVYGGGMTTFEEDGVTTGGGVVWVTGQTVVETITISVVTLPLPGQLVTVGAQDVLV